MKRCQKDLTGQRFGKLIAIRPAGRDSWGHITWLCQCDCGRQKERSGNDLIRGNTTSCGCKFGKREAGKKQVDRLKNRILAGYKRNAQKRGYEWQIADDLAWSICSQPCFYCGNPPSFEGKSGHRGIAYSGIDRLDSSIGYIDGNCVSCCFRCNYTKGTMTHQEFLDFISAVYRFQNSQQGITPAKPPALNKSGPLLA